MEKSGIAYTVIGFLTGISGLKAYAIILGILTACGLGLPIPEDITIIAAGILASKGAISPIGAFIVCFIGVLIGDTILYTVGRVYGRRVFEWKGAKKIFTPERIAKAEKGIQENAKLICFTARFAPGLRAPVYLMSGILRVPKRVFVLMDGLAALLSVPIWVVVGYWFGNNVEKALEVVREAHIYLILFVFCVVGYLIWKTKFKKKTVELAN